MNVNANNRRLTFYESLKLGPIDKFKSHGIFPWKLIISFLLIIFTICQVVIIVGNITNYDRAQLRGLYNNFIDDSDKTDPDYNRRVYLYTINEIKDHLNQSIQNFYQLTNLNLDNTTYLYPDPYLEFRYIPAADKPDSEYYYKINQTYLGPFEMNESSIKTFLNSVIDFKVNYTYIITYPFIYEDNLECEQWNTIQTYSFSERAHFICDLHVENIPCTYNLQTISWLNNFISRLLWIHVLVVLLGCCSLLLTTQSIYKFIGMYMKAKKRKKIDLSRSKNSNDKGAERPILINSLGTETSNSNSPSNSDSSDVYFNPLFESSYSDSYLSEKKNIYKEKSGKHGEAVAEHDEHGEHPKKHFLFLQFWSVFIITGNFFQILGGGLALNSATEITLINGILIGAGCFFACLSIGKYIEFFKEYSTIYQSLRRSFPVVIRFIIGTFPVFLGFLFFTVCVFWRSERFSSVSTASYSLFSMIQGDVIYDNFSSVSIISFFVGQLCLYIFCITFIIIVWNIFISIIEESYVVTKVRNKSSWVYQYLDIEPKLVNIKIHSKPSLQITKKYFDNMEQSSKILNRRISKSLKSGDLLKNKNREMFTELGSLESKDLPNSIKSNKFNKDVKLAKSYFGDVGGLINEQDEFDQKYRESGYFTRKNTVDKLKDKETIINLKFDKIEKRFDEIKTILNEMSNPYTSSSAIKKINAIDNKANEIIQVWLKEYN